jgi:hypothetical protein
VNKKSWWSWGPGADPQKTKGKGPLNLLVVLEASLMNEKRILLNSIKSIW